MQVFQTQQQPPSSNFTLAARPATPGIMQGFSAVSNITVSSVNGFSGTVTFSQPVTQPWITATLDINSVTITPSSPSIVGLNLTVVGPVPFDAPNCPGIACSANVSVTGTAGSYSQTTTIEVIAYGPNFEFFSSQNVPIIEGRSSSVNLTLLGTTYSGPVSLTATVAPGGPKVTINPDKLELNYASWQHPIVTIDTASLQVGDYNVTIKATELASPYVYHEVKLNVFVWAGFQAPPKPTVWSLLLPYISGIISLAFIGVFLAVTLLLARRSSRRNTTSLETMNRLAEFSN